MTVIGAEEKESATSPQEKDDHKKDDSYKCEDCNYQSPSNYSIKAHMARVHGKGRLFECNKCAYKALQKSHLKVHMLARHGEGECIKCDLCDYKTPYPSFLSNHTKKVHKHLAQENVDNTSGSLTSKRKSCMRKSYKMSVQIKGDVYKCEDCDYQNPKKAQLLIHMAESHDKGTLYKCDHCNYKTAKDMYDLQRHIKTHSKESKMIEPINVETIKHAKMESEDAECGEKMDTSLKDQSDVNMDTHSELDETVDPVDQERDSKLEAYLKSDETIKAEEPPALPVVTAAEFLPKMKGEVQDLNITQTNIVGKTTTIAHGATTSLPPPFLNFMNSNKLNIEGLMQPHQDGPERPLDYDLKAAMAKSPVAGGTGCYVVYDKIPEHQPDSNEAGYHQCKLCNREFSSPNSLGQHIKIHMRRVQHRCDLCGHVFGKRDYLLSHVKSHTVDCESTVEKKEAMKLNDVTNTVDKSSKSKNTETEEIKPPKFHSTPLHKKSHVCNQCSFSTAYKSNLRSHIKTVHEKSPRIRNSMEDDKAVSYYCDQCSFKTVYKGNLRSHVKTVHEKVRRNPKNTDFTCDQCSFTTLYRGNLKNHIKVVHEKIMML